MISFNISRTCVMHILRHFWSFTKYIYILLRVGPGPYTCQASTKPHPSPLKTQFEYILWETHPSQFSWSLEFLPFSWQSFTHTDIACGDKSLTIKYIWGHGRVLGIYLPCVTSAATGSYFCWNSTVTVTVWDMVRVPPPPPPSSPVSWLFCCWCINIGVMGGLA